MTFQYSKLSFVSCPENLHDWSSGGELFVSTLEEMNRVISESEKAMITKFIVRVPVPKVSVIVLALIFSSMESFNSSTSACSCSWISLE